MTKIAMSTAEITLRQSAIRSNAPVFNNSQALKATQRSEKLNAFLSLYQDPSGKNTSKSWMAGLHPVMFHQLFNVCAAMEDKTTLAVSRGHGRVATELDLVRSIGTGFNKSAGAIHKFLRFDTPLEMEVVKQGNCHISVPVTDRLERSKYVLARLSKLINFRDHILELDPAKRRMMLDSDTRSRLLLYGSWNSGKIIEYSLEYMARAFAIHMRSDDREELMNGFGSDSFSLKQALENFNFREGESSLTLT